MTETTPQIRPMTQKDVDLALDWAAEEGWNPGRYDSDAFIVTDPNGFFIIEVGGTPAGSVSAVTYDQHYGFLGLYFVRPEFRGGPVGDLLWRTGLGRLGNRTIGINVRLEHVEQYRQLGFEHGFNIVRYEGIGGGQAVHETVDLRVFTFDRLVGFDAGIFGARRPEFLKRWTEPRLGKDVGIIGADGVIAGYGVVRAGRRGHKIGPLFANGEGRAQQIFQTLAASVPGEQIFLNVPVANPEAIELAERHGMTPDIEYARMYMRGEPGGDLARCFGMSSVPLG